MSYVNVQDRHLPFALRYISDVITYRHLCWNLVGSELRARFRRTRLGILWAVLQPLLFALLIATVWGGLRGKDEYLAFTLYVFSGYTTMEYFSNTVAAGQDTLMAAGGFLRQGRIPFFIFQIRPVITGAVIFIFSALGVLTFAAATGQLPPLGPHLLLLPLFFPIAMFFLAPISIIMSIIGTLYRDVKHISGLAVQALFFVSPVILPREWFEASHLKYFTFINPMVGLLDLFRAPVIHGRMWIMQDLIVLGLWSVGLWVIAMIMSANVGRKLVFAV